MFALRRHVLPISLYILSVLAALLCLFERTSAAVPEGLEDVWDPARYIGLDEIKPGMEAYCLTEYGVAGIEKFGLTES